MMNRHIRLDKGDSIYNRNPAGAKDFKGFGNMAPNHEPAASRAVVR
jgi:hypothetical protein